MPKIHFLNVLDGDTNIIEHESGRVTVVDVSNAYDDTDTVEELISKAVKENLSKVNPVPSGKINYHQKETPDNPIQYLKKHEITDIWRFIITHPDMDHLDGIKDFFKEFPPAVVWDTDNNKPNPFEGKGNAGYNPDDWAFYQKIRDGHIMSDQRRTYYAGQKISYYHEDNIKILCPTPAIVKQANEDGEYNDLSYVFLFTVPKAAGGSWKVLFAGDSDNTSWSYILKHYAEDVKDVDILIAPHHGRDSGRDYAFLDVLKPKVTLFGNASSKHLAYDCYPPVRITNNQAGYVIMDISDSDIHFYVKNSEFATDFRANRQWGSPSYNKRLDAYYLGSLTAIVRYENAKSKAA